MKRWLSAMAAQAALSGAFAAEEITLANGRVLTGETVRTEADGVILATGERSLTVPWDMVSPAYRFRHDAVYRAEAMDAPIPPDGSADRFAPLVVPDPGSIGMAVAEPPAWAFRAPDPVPVTEWLQTLDERDEVMGVFAIHYGSGPEHVALFAAGRLDEKGRSGAVWVRDAAGASWEEAARYQADYPDGSAFAFRMISLRSRGAHARVDTDVSCRLDGTTGSLNLVMEVRLGRRGDSETWQLRWQPTLHAPATESLLPVTLLGPPSLRVEPRHDGEDLRAEVSLHAGGGRLTPAENRQIPISVRLFDANGAEVGSATAVLSGEGAVTVELPRSPDAVTVTAEGDAGPFFGVVRGRRRL